MDVWTSLLSVSFLVVGSGLSGAVLAHLIATKLKQSVTVLESRSHVGGNCYTYEDPSTGITVHKYGPHIFHSPSKSIFDWVGGLIELMPYEHHVYGRLQGGLQIPIPVNLETISSAAGQKLTPAEAREWVEARKIPIEHPSNFEEMALATVGAELYHLIFRPYTVKQWGLDPTEIPASVAQRLPVRFTMRRNYHSSNYVAIPKHGYTDLFIRLLDHPRIEVELNSPFDPSRAYDFSHTFFTGAIDSYFGYQYGRLGYRTVSWSNELLDGDFQGTPQVNLLDCNQEETRIIEHKHFEYWKEFDQTIVSREFSKSTGPGDEPFYPVRTHRDKDLLSKYQALSEAERGISFLGRLGTYRYLDMWKTIEETFVFFSEREALGSWPNQSGKG